MNRITTQRFAIRGLLLLGILLPGPGASAQTLWLEEFDGGASTTGFWVDSMNVTDCRWEFAPDSVSMFDFSQDFSGFWPAGPGFDSSFVFLDSDACGGTAVVVDSYLYSAPFDASELGTYMLHFTHQFRARLASFCRVEASADGATWTQVANYTSTDVGYPNPAVADSVDITTATANSATAQVRFEFNAGWDWWWALDSISVTYAASPAAIDEQNSMDRLRVFPNPVNEVLFVDHLMDDAARTRVFDMLGQPVLDERSARSLNVGALHAGTYVIELQGADGATLARTRFVKR